MRRILILGSLLLVALPVGGVALAPAQAPAPSRTAPRLPAKVTPRLEAVAETRLLMQGLTQPNFQGLDRLLRQKPAGTEAWTFARGQALLIAETSNLLMLRPPRNQGQDVWMANATALRQNATALARAAAASDYAGSRAALGELANVCNRCHQSFRVSVRIVPFADAPADSNVPPPRPGP